MFYVRPIARDDLQALLSLSESTGAGLTTLPANAERLDARIGRALASFAGAAEKFDECFVFVLVDGANDHVVGISAIEAAVGLAEPWYNYHVGTQVHASRELDLYTAAPTAATDRSCRKRGYCSLPSSRSVSRPRSSPSFAASWAQTARAHSGKVWAGIFSRWTIRVRIT
jgi:arginine/ornithine succinyltransferase subunit-like protein